MKTRGGLDITTKEEPFASLQTLLGNSDGFRNAGLKAPDVVHSSMSVGSGIKGAVNDVWTKALL